MIDIGGFVMVRAVAKNHVYVGVFVDLVDYVGVLDELRAVGALLVGIWCWLVCFVFVYIVVYDVVIVIWFDVIELELVVLFFMFYFLLELV